MYRLYQTLDCGVQIANPLEESQRISKRSFFKKRRYLVSTFRDPELTGSKKGHLFLLSHQTPLIISTLGWDLRTQQR